ncbi:MAG: hypothetical protein M1826_004564 [Phylliscum demangeonii]|nr:MAG: hypothetical protein M1826_004564 [Phylliscum demangeonii]
MLHRERRQRLAHETHLTQNFVFADVAALASTAAPPRTFRRVGLALWRQHGLSGLYRGCGITVARAVLSLAIIFALYEFLKERIENVVRPKERRQPAPARVVFSAGAGMPGDALGALKQEGQRGFCSA